MSAGWAKRCRPRRRASARSIHSHGDTGAVVVRAVDCRTASRAPVSFGEAWMCSADAPSSTPLTISGRRHRDPVIRTGWAVRVRAGWSGLMTWGEAGRKDSRRSPLRPGIRRPANWLELAPAQVTGRCGGRARLRRQLAQWQGCRQRRHPWSAKPLVTPALSICPRPRGDGPCKYARDVELGTCSPQAQRRRPGTPAPSPLTDVLAGCSNAPAGLAR